MSAIRFLSRARWLALALVAVATAAWPTPDAAAIDRGAEIAYRRLLSPIAEAKRLNADAAVVARMRGVANRLVVAAAAVVPESKRYAWAFNVVPDAEADVRVYPGGRVVLSEGLTTKTGFNDAELAAVIAHAFAHAVLGHDLRRIAGNLAARADSPDPNRRALDAAEATTETFRAMRYDASEIVAADRAAVQMLARAGYDPRAAGSAWRRLGRANKGIVERAPVSDARLAALDADVRAALPLYDETRARAAEDARRPAQPPITRAGPALPPITRPGPPVPPVR